MPTHEEHLAGIEEATGRVRTLKTRFNSVENEWCEAAKQLQKMRDLKQTWIDEYGYIPSDPLMWSLLEPNEKLYTRKAKEYLAVSRDMTSAIAQRDQRICRYLSFLNRESSTEEQDEPGARAERERAAHRERMRQQQSTRAAAEERQRREEAHRRRQQEGTLRQRREEQAQRQARARAEAKERERRDAEQLLERARQEQARRQARAKEEEQAQQQQRSQAHQDSRKRQREQTEQEAPGQPESQKRRKTQHPEHNTTAPTLPYGTLTPAEATLEWRTRFLQPWPTTYYRTLQSFPAPPPIPCRTSPCCTRTGSERILQTCDTFLREAFAGLTEDELRTQRNKWHPDRFSASPEGRGGVREAFRKMAGEVFVVVNEVYEMKKKTKK
ncbi:hypothetical protein KC332_g9809 [Hortaea werneckii]|nr:hypothetical protein KC350_g12538 [Hortaea werneckii]KAI6819094.1 hypothetical protein KC358_g9813 [Hortaea werneckii]KAI6913550.1 hypothetical protein KC348_g12417 [Hortaea werneckii]KAI6931749.1 hypothetical protein KC341_g9425 [Hortaea werneckii]KAI6960398.1 hypothetical protein KC321_g12870 [Hortaea werneckii]